MSEQKILIKNCNNIHSAELSIVENTLNIKLGHNGTGKSTIGEAIRLKAGGGDLSSLTPFIEDDQETVNKPTVGEIPFQKVKVFNEKYISQYLLKPESICDDSYSVFLRTEECDELTEQISEMLSRLQNAVFQGESIQNLADTLGRYTATVKYSGDGISRRGGVGEVLRGGGAGFDKYKILAKYKPFYMSTTENVAKWARWRTDGIDRMDGEICPFCANDLEMEAIEAENGTIKTVFKKSALDTAAAILEFLDICIEKGYILPDAKEILESYMGDESKSQELLSELAHLGEETQYLIDKLQLIMYFKPMNVAREDLQKLEEYLKQMEVDERQISKFYTTDATKAVVKEINGEIGTLLANTDALKNLFFKHSAKLEKMIEKRKEDINNFFMLAGFPYEFDIVGNGENKANTYLKPVGQEKKISNPQDHLSWGERNAFSLVLFMFDAVHEGADLIVLDDPISAFDSNKKFAVIRRMFDNQQDVTFRDKTVLLLTHDMQPVIDYVHGNIFKRFGLTTKVSAEYIENDKGEIVSHKIEGEDLLNVVKLTEKYAADASKPMHVRVVNARKYIELTEESFAKMESYDVLSNLIHGRIMPEDAQKLQMSADAIQRGLENLQPLISGYNSYSQLLKEISTQNLLQELGDDNVYFRILAIRLLFLRTERLKKQLKRIHPAACKFLNETNHIENDYVFQLNPEKFYSIPEIYVKELSDFINEHMGEFKAVE